MYGSWSSILLSGDVKIMQDLEGFGSELTCKNEESITIELVLLFDFMEINHHSLSKRT